MYIYTYLERPFLILRIDEMSRKVKMKTGISRWGPGLETYEFGDLENSTTNLSEAQDILEIPWMTRRKMTRNWAFSRVRNIHTCICICTHVFVMGMFLGRTFRSSPRTRFHLWEASFRLSPGARCCSGGRQARLGKSEAKRESQKQSGQNRRMQTAQPPHLSDPEAALQVSQLAGHAFSPSSAGIAFRASVKPQHFGSTFILGDFDVLYTISRSGTSSQSLESPHRMYGQFVSIKENQSPCGRLRWLQETRIVLWVLQETYIGSCKRLTLCYGYCGMWETRNALWLLCHSTGLCHSVGTTHWLQTLLWDIQIQFSARSHLAVSFSFFSFERVEFLFKTDSGFTKDGFAWLILVSFRLLCLLFRSLLLLSLLVLTYLVPTVLLYTYVPFTFYL